MTETSARRFSLVGIRADGWLDEFLTSAEPLSRVAEIVGPETFALSVIAGARVMELAMAHGGEVRVKYLEGEEGPLRESTLSEFTANVARACLRIEEGDAPLGDAPTEADLRAAVGVRTLLVAPLYGLGLSALIDDGRTRSIEIEVGDTVQVVHLRDLRSLLETRIQNLAAAAQAKPGARIPIQRFEEASEAFEKGEHAKVVERLGPLVASIAALARRPEQRSLDAASRSTVGRGLRELALSLRALGRGSEAEAVLRLAIQWSRDDADAASAFAALGGVLLEAKRDGEAIGLLRRAMALGASDADVLPPLALALARRGRSLAAMGLVRAAEGAGLVDARLAEARSIAAPRLGAAWDAFEDFLEHGFSDDSPS